MRISRLIVALAGAVYLAPAIACAQRQTAVLPGVEVLLTDSMHLIRGKRVGLITNPSGRNRAGTSTIDLLHKAPGVTLAALFGPEHGLRGSAEAGETVASGVDSATGVPIYSLYGETRVPTPEMLSKVDVVLYDIQDVGARVYTYEWTMALSAAAAKKAGKPFIVLDRPDPIRADRIDGNILDPKFASFVGQFPVALRYGLTPGELLRYLVGAKLIDADVHVVPMKGYTRAMWFDETGIPWLNPSPNLRSLDAELLYPGTVFFEGTSATEGRGTDAPFTLIGAPWMTDNGAIAADLNRLALPGVHFDTAARVVAKGAEKFGGQTIPMIHVKVTDRNAVRPVEVGIRMLQVIQAHHPKDFQWRSSIERLAGTDKLRLAVDQHTVDALIKEWNADAERFSKLTAPYQIYK